MKIIRFQTISRSDAVSPVKYVFTREREDGGGERETETERQGEKETETGGEKKLKNVFQKTHRSLQVGHVFLYLNHITDLRVTQWE